ncbi:aspartic endopeptidase [Aspergillus affinis]|uniref:aspartic endopeptidase n=1 Tax=Aspergillus affinis TaxID=1070780 RepID=UPI0022FF2310|nr:aspartic endopeptidase [Aspergillus affinis]KAI9038609.1 aspartic endopeptidase [Aspergillus affinis]
MVSKVPLVHNPRYRRSGIKSYAYLIRKYGIHPTRDGPYSIGRTIHQTGRPFTSKPVGGRVRFHDVMQKQFSNKDMHQVDADDVQNDSMYFVPVSIGSPPQVLNLVPDTGPSDLWVRSIVQSREDEDRRAFDPSKSTTSSIAEQSSWKVSNLDNSSASGSVVADNVILGEEVTVKTQHIAIADTLSSGFDQAAADGVLGLAFGAASNIRPEVKSLVETIQGQDDLASSVKLFTAKFSPSNGSGQEGPFFTFGGIDENVGEDIIHYAPIDKSHKLWSFESTTAYIAGTVLDRPQNIAIIDTDAALTLLEDRICQAIYDAIPGAFYDGESQGFLFPTNTDQDQLPTIQLDIGGKLFSVPKSSLGFSEAKPGYVYGGVQSRGSIEFDVLGRSFLEGIYAVFDISKLRFGAVQIVN